MCQRYLRWRLIVVYLYCIVDSIPISPSLALSLIQGTVTCSMPAQQHYLSPLTTVPLHLPSNKMMRSLSLSLSLSFRVPLPVRCPQAALLVPADDRATASTFQQNDARYRLDGGLAGYHYIAKAQRHLSRHTSSCASPRWRYRWPIVLSALQSMCITLNRIITLNPTQCFAPYTTCLLPTTYYLT